MFCTTLRKQTALKKPKSNFNNILYLSYQILIFFIVWICNFETLCLSPLKIIFIAFVPGKGWSVQFKWIPCKKKIRRKKICNLWQSSWTWHFDTFHSRVLHLYQDLSRLSSLFPDFDHRIYFSAWINVKRRSWICALFVTRNLYRAHLLGKSSQKSNWGEDWGEGQIRITTSKTRSELRPGQAEKPLLPFLILINDLEVTFVLEISMTRVLFFLSLLSLDLTLMQIKKVYRVKIYHFHLKFPPRCPTFISTVFNTFLEIFHLGAIFFNRHAYSSLSQTVSHSVSDFIHFPESFLTTSKNLQLCASSCWHYMCHGKGNNSDSGIKH